MPVHNEDVHSIFAALRAMVETISEAGVLEHFDIYILSDSTSLAHGIAEELNWAKLCQEVNGFGKIFYRRRKLRLHKKSGNVSDFCRRWGRQYKYMITLDADSLMGGELLIRMVNMMESREDIGILQTAPMAINQISLISRLQQFSSHTYGPIFFAGLRFWQMDETGFWGHNAIVRIEPFMKYCSLPTLSGGPPFGGEILSHDFVEAALMRRAGWGIWLAYELEDSFEELPPNLLGELARDKRWCQGNIQHLRLMFMKGISFGHRMLFLQGNLFYFSSFMWFMLLILMTVNAVGNYFEKHVYFASERSLFPAWVVEHRSLSIHLLVVTAIFLFSPKILSVILIGLSRERAQKFGGVLRLTISVILETLFSTMLAPLRMVFHSWYCLLNLTGRKLTWGNQERLQKQTSFREAFRAHFLWSLGALIWGFVAYAVSKTLFWWLSVIVGPLIFGIPISMIFSYPSIGLFFRKLGLFLTPPEQAPSKALQRYQALLSRSKNTTGSADSCKM
jgi:membrane glycosyltransferase